MRSFISALTAAALLAACGGSSGATKCTSSTDCAAGQVCIAGDCQSTCPSGDCAGTDGGIDGGPGTSGDAGDAGPDAGTPADGGDAGSPDAGGRMDAGLLDGGRDAGRDAGPDDAGLDAGQDAGNGGGSDAGCAAGFATCGTGPACSTEISDDPGNCGGCGNQCLFANAAGLCVNGGCQLGACDTGYADCADSGVACATDTGSDVSNCGGCNTVCTFAKASATCVSGVCTLGTCDPGYADCTGSGTSCETNLKNDAANCGTCGKACAFPNATASCVDGECVQGACDPGFAECGGPSCSVNLGTDPGNCGQCGNVCSFANAQSSCVGGACEQTTCDPGWSNCAGLADAGCTTYTVSKTLCGDCTTACTFTQACVLQNGQPAATCVPQPVCWPEQLQPPMARYYYNYAFTAAPGGAIGDLDGDGNPDIVFATSGQYPDVVLTSSDGGFLASVLPYSVGSNYSEDNYPINYIYEDMQSYTSVALADLNGDGRPDYLWTGEYYDYTYDYQTNQQTSGTTGVVGIELSTPDGGYYAYPATTYAAPQLPNSLAVVATASSGLFLAVAGNGGPDGGAAAGTIQIYANSNGTLTSTTTLSATGAAQSLLSADLDGDGVADLAYANPIYTGESSGLPCYQLGVTVLLGNGNGTFGAPLSSTGAAACVPPNQPLQEWLTVADFLGNGGQQLAWGPSNAVGAIELTQVSGGALQTSSLLSPAQPWAYAIAADFNGDGLVDLAGLDVTNAEVHVVPNTAGAFSGAGTAYLAGAQPSNLIVWPFSSPGYASLLIMDNFTVQGFVMPNDGTGRLEAPTALPSALTQVLFGTGATVVPGAIYAGDLNGDGKPDLAFAWGAGDAGGVQVLLGLGDGGFTAAGNHPVGGSPTSIAVADFTGDGRPDLAVTSSTGNDVSILLGESVGFTLASTVGVGHGPTKVLAMTTDGGTSAIAVLNSGDQTISVLQNLTDGGFRPQFLFDAGQGLEDFAVADFNLDNVPDVAFLQYPGGVSIYLGEGATFALASTALQGSYFCDPAIAAGDVNGDGIPDLVIVDPACAYYDVLIGAGDGSFSTLIDDGALLTAFTSSCWYVGCSEGPLQFQLTDVNKDGALDIVMAVLGPGSHSPVSLLYGDGQGDFGPELDGGFYGYSTVFVDAPSVAPSQDTAGFGVGDFNGDGRLDLAVLGASLDPSQDVGIDLYLNQCH